MRSKTDKVRINGHITKETLETIYRLSARLGVGKGEVIDYLAERAKETALNE